MFQMRTLILIVTAVSILVPWLVVVQFYSSPVTYVLVMESPLNINISHKILDATIFASDFPRQQ
jgi:hypothetical protein